MGVLSRYDYPLYVNRRFLDCSGLLCFSQPTPLLLPQPRNLGTFSVHRLLNLRHRG
jgi:hypothetical protein